MMKKKECCWMKDKANGRWQRVIIGIGLALIMLGSVISVMTYL